MTVMSPDGSSMLEIKVLCHAHALTHQLQVVNPFTDQQRLFFFEPNMATADITNWRTAPHNIWAFHNIDKLLSNQVVKKGEKEASLHNHPHMFDGFKMELGGGLDLPSFEIASDTDGLVLLHRGKVVYENYRRDNKAASKHILMSM